MKKIKIFIKHINTTTEFEAAKEYASKVGMKEFHSLSFQFSKIPEGIYQIDTEHIFDNQYNAIDENGKRYRIFEFSCKYNDQQQGRKKLKPLPNGYYISEGIEQIRDLQKQIKVCGYCGKQYLNTKLEICNSCRGSEYLTPDYYHLLNLKPLLNKGFIKKDLPANIIEDIKQKQQEKALAKELQRVEDTKKRLKQEFFEQKLEYKFKTDLLKTGLHSNYTGNMIIYTHSKNICFGWRKGLNDSEKDLIINALLKIDGVTRSDEAFIYTYKSTQYSITFK